MQESSSKYVGAVGYGCTKSTNNRPYIPPQPSDVPLEVKEWLDDVTGVKPLPPIEEVQEQ